MTDKNGKLRSGHLSSFFCYSIAPAPGFGAQALERHVPKRTARLRLGDAVQAQILEHVVVHTKQHAALAPYLKRKLDRADQAHNPLRYRARAFPRGKRRSSPKAAAPAAIRACNARHRRTPHLRAP